jgi:hypothetical protein
MDGEPSATSGGFTATSGSRPPLAGQFRRLRFFLRDDGCGRPVAVPAATGSGASSGGAGSG